MYRIRVWEDGRVVLGPVDVPGSVTSVTISGLDPAGDYTFTVSVVDAGGVEGAPAAGDSAGSDVLLAPGDPVPETGGLAITFAEAPAPDPEPEPEPAPDPPADDPAPAAPGGAVGAAVEGATSGGGGGGPCFAGAGAPTTLPWHSLATALAALFLLRRDRD
jgi:hypothetical protein